jgi:hypothetical protein
MRNVAALLCTLPVISGLVIRHPTDAHQENASVSLLPSADIIDHAVSFNDQNASLARHAVDKGVILFLGCSLDVFAIKHFCTSAQSQLIGFENNFAYLAYCSAGGFTLVYAFQPGASAPPYWRDYVGTLNSQQIILQSSQDIPKYFGRPPTAVVVDASLWDVSNWWQKAGMPPEPYPVPQRELSQWCHTDLPQLLSWVSAAYPKSEIAFRTPPPVFPGNGYGQSVANVEEMNRCAKDWGYDAMTQKVFQNYHLIDYHDLVEKFLLHQTGPRLSFYKDVLHPGKELSLEYINTVMTWVRSLQTNTTDLKMQTPATLGSL